MPEGHTIHRLARDHRRWFKGQQVTVSSPQGRFAQGAQALNGLTFDDAFAHGKHLFYGLTGLDQEPVYVHIHLGLFGRFRRHRLPLPDPTPNVRLRLIGDERGFDLSGPTCCETLDDAGVLAIRQRLGPDPLNTDFTAEDCIAALARRKAPIGSVLLNQQAIAGLGNIYRCELLFMHGIDPQTPARDLSADTVVALWATACEWLRLGVKTNRIITTLPPGTTKVSRGQVKERVMIYKARTCPRCAAPVTRYEMGNRTMFACHQCQTRTS